MCVALKQQHLELMECSQLLDQPLCSESTFATRPCFPIKGSQLITGHSSDTNIGPSGAPQTGSFGSRPSSPRVPAGASFPGFLVHSQGSDLPHTLTPSLLPPLFPS